MQRSLATYTSRDINDWKNEIGKLPGLIQTNKSKQLDSELQLVALVPELEQFIREKVVPSQQKIEGLKAQINVLTLPKQIEQLSQVKLQHQTYLNNFESQLSTLTLTLNPLNQEITNVESKIDIINANNVLLSLQPQQSSYHEAIVRHQNAIYSYNQTLESLSSQILNLQNQLTSLRTQQDLDMAFNHSGFSHHHHGHHGHYDDHFVYDAFHTIGDISQSLSISGLETEISRLQSQQRELLRKRQLEQNELDSHNSQLYSINTQIEQQNKIIRNAQFKMVGQVLENNLYELQQLLAQKKNEREPHLRTKQQLDLAISTEHSSLSSASLEWNEKSSLLEKSKPLAKPFSNNTDVSDLSSALQQEEQIQTQLQNLKREKENVIASHRSIIQTANATVLQSQQQLSTMQSNVFIKKYLNEPQALFTKLADSLASKIAEFENDFPYHQTLLMRTCLFELDNKISFIKHTDISPPNSTYPDLLDQELIKEQERLMILHGLLWDRIDRLSLKDLSLANALTQAFSGYALNHDESKQHYQLFKNTFLKQMDDVSEQTLRTHEISAYQNAQQSFRTALAAMPANAPKEVRHFYKNGTALLNELNHDADHAMKNNKTDFDFKYHARILTSAERYLKNPADHVVSLEFKKLAAHNEQGKASTRKKVYGTLLAFLGAGIIVAGLILGAGSLGFASAPAAGLIIGGGATMVTGFGLFAHGREKGAAQKLHQFDDAASHSATTGFFNPPKQPSPPPYHPEVDQNHFTHSFEPSAPAFNN